jgi:3-oxoacyl-[acyl-carrier-protein] synthase-1
MAGTPCAIVAVGITTALGTGVDATWARLLAGDQSRLTVRDDLVPGRSLLVGQIREPLARLDASLARYACRNNEASLTALRQIEPEVRRAMARVGRDRVAVVMGSSTSGVASAETAIETRVRTGALTPTFDYVQFEMGGVAEFIAESLGVAGPAYSISTACSSGAKAIAAARTLLELEVCDAVITGGTDTLCRLTANGFTSLQAVADEPSNPFSVNRRGLTLGEGAAILLLERAATGVQVIGVGESSDAFHMSSPDPDGAGAEQAMRAALRDAGLDPSAIRYVNLHGTGTPLNDATESAAVARVFGGEVPCSSTKPLVGHALGASGAIEIAFCWMMLSRRGPEGLCPPPHCWDGLPDPALPRLHLVGKGERAPADERAAVLTNSFGFGGNNCAVILGTSS